MTDIQGTGYGSSHDWQRGETCFRCTYYKCKNCGAVFSHYYPDTPSIFKAIAELGVPDKCEGETK